MFMTKSSQHLDTNGFTIVQYAHRPMMLKNSTSNGRERNEQTLARLDIAVLKGVYEKCTRNYEGKYRSGLFDVNVRLDDAEVTLIGLLIEGAKQVLLDFAGSHPVYPRFDALLHEMRQKLGTFGEAGRIIGDPSATAATNDKIGVDVPAIRAPSAIKDCYTWTLCVEGLEDVLKMYRSGNARGLATTNFGKNVKEVYRLIKDSKYRHCMPCVPQ